MITCEMSNKLVATRIKGFVTFRVVLVYKIWPSGLFWKLGRRASIVVNGNNHKDSILHAHHKYPGEVGRRNR